MHIVYFYQYFGTSKGGWSTRVHEMGKRWVEDGHKVTVVTTPYDKSDLPRGKGIVYRLNYDGIDVIVINFLQSNKNPVFKRILDFIKYLLVALYFGFKLPYDVAICSSGPISVGVMGIVCCRIRGKKFVFEVRDLWPAGAIELGVIRQPVMIRLSRWFEKRCYDSADLIVAASEGMRNDIRRRFGKENIVVVTNASDMDLFQQATPVKLPDHLIDKKLILYTGSLGKMYNCMEIMRAAHLIDRKQFPDLHIVIIGDGVDLEEMKAYQKIHNIENVTFTGLIPKTELAGWYKHAIASILTIFPTPVLNTISPNKVFDSFAAGVPIIQTTQGWIKKLVIEKSCGINAFPDHPESLAEAFTTYVRDPELQRLHAKNALDLARFEFSRDRCASYMISQIQKLFPPAQQQNAITPATLTQQDAEIKRQSVLFVVDWYTPSSHASSIRVRPWIDVLRADGRFDVEIYTDKCSRNEWGVRPNLFHSPDNRTKPGIRVFQELLLGLELFFKLLFRKKRLVIISSPPFIASCLAVMACYVTGKPYVFDVRDLYPLVYANSGFITKRNWFFRLMFRIARFCYRNAVFTSSVTPQLVDYIQNTSGSKNVHLIKNGFNSQLFIPSEEKYEIFTLVFHGNIGQFQNPYLMMEVVKELNRRNERFHCIAIGSGSRQKVFEEHDIPNFEYLGRISNEELAAIIRKAHVGLSFRTDDVVSINSIPVRVSEYVGVAIPIVLTPKSEGGDLLQNYGVGKVFGNDQIKEICAFIQDLKNDSSIYDSYRSRALEVRSEFSREDGARIFGEKLCDYLRMDALKVE